MGHMNDVGTRVTWLSIIRIGRPNVVSWEEYFRRGYRYCDETRRREDRVGEDSGANIKNICVNSYEWKAKNVKWPSYSCD